MQFTGQVFAKMDAKGRLFFPSDFRKSLGNDAQRFVLRRDVFEECLVIYPLATWEQEVSRLRASLRPWQREDAMLFRAFMAEVEQFGLDANGRFVMPKRFMPLCSDTRSMVFVGLDDRIELWDADRLQTNLPTADAYAALLEARIGGNAKEAHA